MSEPKAYDRLVEKLESKTRLSTQEGIRATIALAYLEKYEKKADDSPHKQSSPTKIGPSAIMVVARIMEGFHNDN